MIVDFFTSEMFGFLLKLFSGLAAAAFGMLGIGTKTREDDGRLTRNGKIALAGIIVAGLLAARGGTTETARAVMKCAAPERGCHHPETSRAIWLPGKETARHPA